MAKLSTAPAPHKRWYKLKRWRRIRDETFARDLFTCRMCGKLEGDTSKLVCDHVNRHNGNEQLFWAGPFQTLCSNCHSMHKQSQELTGKVAGADADGIPVDPSHHWNA